MELKELPKTNEKELSDDQKKDLFGNIIRGKDVTEKIETSRGVFEVKFPRMRDLEIIGRVLARRMNGLSVESMDPNIYNLMSEIATLDVVVVSGPAWFENAKKENPEFSWGFIPTQAFIQEVYAKAYEFRLKVSKMLEPSEANGNNEVAAGVSDDGADMPGLFEGLSGSK